MNAMAHGGRHTSQATVYSAPTTTTSLLDRAALAAGAADRRKRLLEIEDAMDQACETAAQRPTIGNRVATRTAWDRWAWQRYLTEAITQAVVHGQEMEALRRDVDRLDHLVACLS